MYLSATSGVLGSAASDQFGIVVLEEILVKIHMFVFCKDGIVALKTIFGEQSFISEASKEDDLAEWKQLGSTAKTADF